MKYEFLKLLKDKAFLISLAACLIITVFMSVEKSQPDSQTKYVMEQYNYDTSEANLVSSYQYFLQRNSIIMIQVKPTTIKSKSTATLPTAEAGLQKRQKD